MLTVSQEFINPEFLKNNAQGFIASLKDVFSHRDDVTTDIGRVPHYRVVRKELERTSYASLRETKVYVPTGLSVGYKTYLAVLEPCVKVNQGLLPRVLSPFSRWLGELINDPTKLEKLSNTSSIRDFEPHNLDTHLSELGECFEKGKNVNKVPFKQAFSRNADVKEVLAKAEDLTGQFIGIDRKAVIKKVDEIADNLEVLIGYLEDDDTKVGSEVEQLLSQVAYTVAREVEFYGVMAYHLTQLTTALKDTTDAIGR